LVRGLTSVTSWTVLATLSLATAAAWVSVAAIGARYSGEIAVGWNQGGRQLVRVLRQDVVERLFPILGGAWTASGEWLGSVGLDMQTAAIGYGGVILVCASPCGGCGGPTDRGPVDAAS
jgi:hypothetical protein